MKIGTRKFAWGERTYVLAVINATPDSFSGDGILGANSSIETAIARAEQFASEGADIIDIGGESTRPASVYPDARPVTAQEEIARVVPLIAAISKRVDIPISIDSRKASVASAAADAGAVLINDVSMLGDPEMPRVAADRELPIVISHIRREARYEDVVNDVAADLTAAAERAISAGVPRYRLILDPGIGFAKTPDHSLEVLRRLAELKALGYPLLVGTSRKSFIGAVLGLPVDQRVEGTAATVALAIAAGADIIRVHEVAEMKRVAVMADAVVRGRTQASARSDPSRRWATAYVGLGSNVGDRAANLSEARERLGRTARVVAESSVYESAPHGVTETQSDYFNQVVKVRTDLSPEELLLVLLGIESSMGRTRTGKAAPRNIDLDLLTYGEAQFKTDGLTVPHPRLHERAFVLHPLAELAPGLVIPGTGNSVKALRGEVTGQRIRRLT